MLPWVRQAFRLRLRAIGPALAALGELLGTGAVRLSYSASGREARATFRLDGDAFLHLNNVESAFVGDVIRSLTHFGEELAAGRDMLAALRAAIDVAVGVLFLAVALLAAVEAGGLWEAALRLAAASAAYGLLVPFRNTLMRLALRALTRAALHRAISRFRA